jgi:hypothetical protein
METAETLMQVALAAKRERRRELAALPYAEKVRIVLRLQRMGDAIRATRGARARSWLIDEATLMPPERTMESG